jgi:hypothetical protein
MYHFNEAWKQLHLHIFFWMFLIELCCWFCPHVLLLVTGKRKFDNNFNKQILKNPEKGQLLLYFRKMIHLWLPFRIMVDNFNHHQTWLPPLLKIEHLTKKCKNNTKFASNWHFTEFFRIFLLIFFVKLSIYGHVWWKFESLTIILKEDHNCIISLKFGSNWHFIEFKKIIFAFFCQMFYFQ